MSSLGKPSALSMSKDFPVVAATSSVCATTVERQARSFKSDEWRSSTNKGRGSTVSHKEVFSTHSAVLSNGPCPKSLRCSSERERTELPPWRSSLKRFDASASSISVWSLICSSSCRVSAALASASWSRCKALQLELHSSQRNTPHLCVTRCRRSRASIPR